MSLFTFNLELILKPEAYHSKKSVNTGWYFLKAVHKQSKWPLL